MILSKLTAALGAAALATGFGSSAWAITGPPVPETPLTITFDDLTDGGGGTPIASGYAGLEWTNLDVIDAVDHAASPNGFTNGMVSSPNVAFDPFGAAASFGSASPFTLNSVYLTGVWNNGLNVQITGLREGAPVDSVTEVVDTTAPTLVVLNWTNIQEVEFTPSGGTSAGYVAKGGAEFALDDLAINGAVPEPTTWAMMMLGVFGAGAMLRSGRARASIPSTIRAR